MKICILGWYGTETLGDRSILAGLFILFNKIFNNFNIAIGSLYTFLTERTMLEEMENYKNLAPNMKIEVFSSKNINQLKEQIADSNVVIMGGGPIMDLVELEIINYGFNFARKQNIKTMLLGCGIGPLQNKDFIKIVGKILGNADLSIFRDYNSLEIAKKIIGNSISEKMFYSQDPAILPVYDFINKNEKKTSRKLSINFREFPSICFEKQLRIDELFISKLINNISLFYDEVHLVPMHTFFIGGDDRRYLEKIKTLTSSENIKVLHKPLNLYELFNEFYSSETCIGMRYHSIVFQTLLNGNNFIFDYCDQGKGKITSFIKLNDKGQFYKDRYINMQNCGDISNIDNMSSKILDIFNRKEFFKFDFEIYNRTQDFYIKEFLKICTN